MKITKSQLKQLIKEVISEAWDDNDDEWLTADEMRKSPRSKMMGPSPIAGQEDPSDTEGGYTMAQEEENFRTVDYMIDFYREKPRMWQWAENQYHDMAHGNDPEGIRSEMYSDWSDEDFAEVIAAMGESPMYYEEKDKSFSEAGEEIEKKGTEGVFTAKAKKAGMGVQAYAKKVLAKDSKASTKTKRQAAFAKGAATVARKRKKK